MDIVNWLPFIGSILVVILGWVFGRRKESSDIVSQTSEAVLNLLKPLNDRIDTQNIRIKTLEDTVGAQEEELIILRPLPQIVTAMTRGINILITQICKYGLEPEWTPANLEPVVLKLESRLKKSNGKKD